MACLSWPSATTECTVSGYTRIWTDREASPRQTWCGSIAGAKPAVHGLAGEGIVTIEQCCLDFDGGGPDDDGLLVMGVPPDRVLMAAIYETKPTATPRGSRPSGWPLR